MYTINSIIKLSSSYFQKYLNFYLASQIPNIIQITISYFTFDGISVAFVTMI